jgi:methionyl-tRNA formyltransferase
MDPGLDTGPILAQRTERIAPDDTAASLATRLAELGATLLIDTLPDYLAGRIAPRVQDETLATYAPQLKKEAGRLDFTRPAAELARRVRAFSPWPGTYALLPHGEGESTPLKVLRAEALEDTVGSPGVVAATPRGPAVGCGAGALLLVEVQPPGKRPMAGADFARGARGFIGSNLAR